MINFKRLKIVLFLSFFILTSSFSFSSSVSTANGNNYDRWLNLVQYIITPTEKKIFLSLKNPRDKDAFIKLFWKQRDPTPGTEKNEFMIEHIKRFKYANKHFGRGSQKQGRS